MALIERRGVIEDKIYGILPDRFILGREAIGRDFSVLPLDDSRRVFKFFDFIFQDESIRSTITGGSEYYSTYGIDYAWVSNEMCHGDHKIPVLPRHTPPLFYSSCMSGFRDYQLTQIVGIADMLGNFKGPGPIFTIDGTGNAGDYLAPGMKLMVSPGGLVHKYLENGEIEPLMHQDTTAAGSDCWNNVYALRNTPMVLGWHPKFAHHGYYQRFVNSYKNRSLCSNGIATRWNHIRFSNFIGQDATYIYYLQIADYNGSITNYQYLHGSCAPPDMYELIAVRKSDGKTFDTTLSSAHYMPTNVGGFIFSEVTTTEATPVKAIFMLMINGYSNKSSIAVNKIVANTVTNLGNLSYANSSGPYKATPTRLMEHKQASYSNYWKAYLPAMISTDNNCTIQLLRQIKTLASTNTIVACTMTGLPAEYASTDGTKIKAMPVSPQEWDACWCAEIDDSGDQYIAYWIGRTKNPWWLTTNIAGSSYSEVSDIKYRWFLVFKVDPTDDSKLIYQSCIPEFKLMKPIHGVVASPDNKHMVVSNEDGVYCYIWSSTTKSFIAVDNIALPGVVSMGMEDVNSANKNNVFVEVLDVLTKGDDCKSYVYQISFGDYTDVDLRYWTGSAWVADFGQATLPTNKVGNVYQPMTATIDVRVKNKVNGVETAFVSGKTVKLKLSGVRDSDGISFVGNDVGNPMEKTITTGSDWVTVTMNYSTPVNTLKITSEIKA